MTRFETVAMLLACEEIERLAAAVYTEFARQSPVQELGSFWRTMAQDEKHHAAQFDLLSQLTLKHPQPLLLDNHLVMSTLRTMRSTVEYVRKGSLPVLETFRIAIKHEEKLLQFNPLQLALPNSDIGRLLTMLYGVDTHVARLRARFDLERRQGATIR